MRDDLAGLVKGDVMDDAQTRQQYSRDTSVFERTPEAVVFPKDADDVAAVVRYAAEKRRAGAKVSVSPRSAGTDMSGGTITDSISMVFTKYMNRIGDIGEDYAEAEPGVFYRDFEKATLEKRGMIMPSYPASRGLCAIGGIIANNSGGELTLRYGKTSRYVRKLDVVLSDGSKAALRPLSQAELEEKRGLQNLEGDIYRGIHSLIQANRAEITAARPNVTKNSAGYALWDVEDEKSGAFDLTQLVCGSQGTLAVVTNARLGLVKTAAHRSMLVVFLSDLAILPEIVRRVLSFKPESFESYDDQTFKLAVRFIPQIVRHFGLVQMAKLAFSFIPEVALVATGGVPKLVLMAEFAEETPEAALEQAERAREALGDLPVRTKLAKSETAAAKYWTIRRESFALLRKNLRGLYASPFIDDLVVHPDDYPRFLPQLTEILSRYDLLYTIAGHIGDANFHIIPLMDLGKPESRRAILELSEEVYKLVASFKGSITGEHNDGLIRTPYLPLMYGEKMCALFAEVKRIFDPLDVLNPGKKVPVPGEGGTVADIERFMITPVR